VISRVQAILNIHRFNIEWIAKRSNYPAGNRLARGFLFLTPPLEEAAVLSNNGQQFLISGRSYRRPMCMAMWRHGKRVDYGAHGLAGKLLLIP
jgi:hypothetical protein